jgi:hypothetical protein
MRFFIFLIMAVFWLLQELNVFYLKTVLWIPPNHSLNFCREMLYAFTGACAMSEMYHFLNNKDVTVSKIGRYSWLVFAALIVETLIVVKFGWDIVTIPIPTVAIVGWALFFIGLGMWIFWKFTYPMKDWPIIGFLFRKSKNE